MKMLSFHKDEVIFKQGEFAQCMYDIVSGSVGVFVGYGTENETRLTVLKAGDFLGEMGLIDVYPRSATAVAMEDTELREIGEKEFSEFFRGQPERLRDRTEDYEGACVVLDNLKATQKAPEKRSRSLLERAKALAAIYNDAMAQAASSPEMNAGFYGYYVNRF